MCFFSFAILISVVGARGLEFTTVTGSNPEPCTAKLDHYTCMGRADGNYEFLDKNNGKIVPNFFTQCSNSEPYCHSCWPETLEFSQRCNQCLYNKHDDCYTTKSWQPHSTYTCPDLCPAKGPAFRGNIDDPLNPFHYVGCWDGVTVGCVVCPAGLKFNEPWNACLYDGLYITKP